METWITFICGGIVAVGVTLTVWSKIRETRVNQRGWRVSLGIDAIRYQEKFDGSNWQSISIKPELKGREGSVSGALVRSADSWKSAYPEWARHRRDEIVARLRSEFPRMSVTELPNHPAEPASPKPEVHRNV